MSTLITALVVYTSEPASPQMVTFLMAAAQGQHLDIRPTSALPPPDVQRRQQMRAERGELLTEIKTCEFLLEQYGSGQLQPDAGHEQGLHFLLDSLNSRLRGINTVLSTEKGAEDNA